VFLVGETDFVGKKCQAELILVSTFVGDFSWVLHTVVLMLDASFTQLQPLPGFVKNIGRSATLNELAPPCRSLLSYSRFVQLIFGMFDFLPTFQVLRSEGSIIFSTLLIANPFLRILALDPY
jgi:hypothetical protein